MNIIRIMTPKINVKYLSDTDTLLDGIQEMRNHGYTSVPVISDDCICVGTLSDGDCLRYIFDHADKFSPELLSGVKVSEVMNKSRNPAVKIDVSDETLFSRITNCNFVPVTDDRGCFVGIVTRRAVLKYYEDVISGGEKREDRA
ncbi:MAG: CBS domain-containing protein [Clostridiales bacterium]|nr:CBS domain-containing protein [Clostridiales bacterium]MCD8311836.1 CBS domain-containing protein [Bacillota bacterium]MCD8314297.1 CBS domain-containing protein [Bacillota bacterium]